jgi:hypothetical protein
MEPQERRVTFHRNRSAKVQPHGGIVRLKIGGFAPEGFTVRRST